MMAMVPRVMSVLSKLFPRLGARIAWYLWLHPHGRANTAFPAGAERFELEVLGRKFSGFSLGSGDPVLLLHGWGGASTDMAPLASAVADAGYRAVAPDLPGHGPDRGSRTNAFRMAAATGAVVGAFGLPRAVVAHSFGAVVTFAAFPFGGPQRVVLVAPAARAGRFLDVFTNTLRMSAKSAKILAARFRSFVGPLLMRILDGDGDVAGADMLVLHDPADDRTPYADSANYVAGRSGAKLVDVPGAGHKGILKAEHTIAETVAFIRSA